jgi:hypothetical protein
LDILLVTAFLVTRLLVCGTAPDRGVHHPEVSGRGILGEGRYDPKPPAETTKDLRWRVRCDESACFSGGPLLLAFLRWCGRCVPAARRLRLQRYRAIPRKSLSGNHFGSTEGHVIIRLRGPGYDSGSGLAPLLRNRDKRHLLYLMACLPSGEAVLPRAYDTDIYLTGLGMLLRTVYLFGLISRPGAPGYARGHRLVRGARPVPARVVGPIAVAPGSQRRAKFNVAERLSLGAGSLPVPRSTPRRRSTSSATNTGDEYLTPVRAGEIYAAVHSCPDT